MRLGGNFCFGRAPTEPRAKGSPRSGVPAGHAFCLSTWNLGVAFPGHPSPTHPQKHKRARLSPIAHSSQGILLESLAPEQRQTAPLRAARLTFAQLARRGAPLRPPRSPRVSRSRRAGSRPPRPRCQGWVPCPAPRAPPGSLLGTLALPGSGKVSSSPPKKLPPELREEGGGRGE